MENFTEKFSRASEVGEKLHPVCFGCGNTGLMYVANGEEDVDLDYCAYCENGGILRAHDELNHK